MDLIGKEVDGRYKIMQLIGQGGMSTVYLARDLRLDRTLVLKVLPPALLHEPSFRSRFQREAQVIASLRHPNIVTIFDFGETDGIPYIAMEYLSGVSLSELLRSGKTLSLADILNILGQIANALDHAHQQSILHRDIKPSNINVEETGKGQYRVGLLDFGLARLFEGGDTALTGSGAIVGTPSYMAPEQAQGDFSKIGPATDLYALAIVTYEMLTGGLPFRADTPMGLVLHHITSLPPPPTELRPDLPASVDSVLLKALAKEPDKRYQTASDFVAALAVAFKDTRSSESAASVKPIASPIGVPSFPVPIEPRPEVKPKPEYRPGPGVFARLWAAIKVSFSSARETFQTTREPVPPSKTEPLPVGEITPPFSPVPMPDVPPSLLVSPSASLILRPHLYELLDPLKDSTIRELLSEQEPERLVDYIVVYGGRRFIVTGYGSFGGTTLTREIVEAVSRQLRQYGGTGQLLAVRFDLVEQTEQAIIFKVTLRDGEPLLAYENLTATEPTVRAAPYRITEVLNVLLKLLTGQVDKSTLAKRIVAVWGGNMPPLRPVLVIDKVIDRKSLELFINHPLFEQKIVTYLVVTPREQYDRWDDQSRRFLLKHKKFEVWSVPSLWESNYSLVRKTVDLCFSGYQLDNRGAQDLHHDFMQHISFVSRGALGAVLNELQQLKYWRLDEHTKQPFIDFNALDRELIRHNASIQGLLDANWSRILGQNFPGRERADRAKQGVYALIDWIIDYATFTLDEVLEAAGQTAVIISPYPRLRGEVVMRLLDVLVEKNYLQRVENEFDIIWGRDVSQGGVTATRVINRSEEIMFWEEQLSQYHRNWQKLVKDRAMYAEGEVPLHLQNAIEAEEMRIKETEVRLAELRGTNDTE